MKQLVAMALCVLTLVALGTTADAKKKSRYVEPMGAAKLAEQNVRYGTVSLAEMKRADTRVACAPFANGNNTQVLATFAAAAEKCGSWSNTNLIWLADYKENMLCSYIGGKCKPVALLPADGQAYFAELKGYLNPTGNGCRPVTDWKTFIIETVPAGGGHGCSLSNAAVRAYALLTGTVTFLDGKGKEVGYAELSPDRFHAVLAEARERWGVTQ